METAASPTTTATAAATAQPPAPPALSLSFPLSSSLPPHHPGRQHQHQHQHRRRPHFHSAQSDAQCSPTTYTTTSNFYHSSSPPSPTLSTASSSPSSDFSAADSSASTMSAESIQAEDAYFSSNPPPKNLDAHAAQARAFIDAHAAAGRRVVLITSGGTTVPLEKQTVRFIDNFSAGTRGATSAEVFLEAGYAVIFLHREFSLLPYSRHYSHSRDCFLDFLAEGDDGQVGFRRGDGGKILDVLRAYRAARDGNRLLMLPFVTIGDYLHELRSIARLMRPLGPSGLLYLAAAVSDFFVPPDRMAEHKIQSTDAVKSFSPERQQQQQSLQPAAQPAAASDETFDNFDASPRANPSKRLVVDLDPVPKFLHNLVDGWAPQGMIVSYKLETDPTILVHKARYSLDRYQHHLVIGNLLATRKWEVVFVSPGRPDRWLRVPRDGGWGDAEGRPLRPDELPAEGDPAEQIEDLIIPAVAELHGEHVARWRKSQ